MLLANKIWWIADNWLSKIIYFINQFGSWIEALTQIKKKYYGHESDVIYPSFVNKIIKMQIRVGTLILPY